MRIVVIGGTSFMGPHVVQELCRAGHSVTVFHRGKTGTCADSAEHIHADRRALPVFRPQFEQLAPEVVVHMIAMNQSDADNTLEAFRGIARRVVLISSMDVYQAFGGFIGKEDAEIDNTPLTEDAPLRTARFPFRTETTAPDSVLYNYDKIVVEETFLNSRDFETTVLRLPAVYGPSDKQHRTYDYVKRMMDGRIAILLDEEMANWRWSRGYVEDVALGICLAATAATANRIYNISEPAAQTEQEWLEAIARSMRWSGRIVRKRSGKEEYRWAQHIACDPSRIRAELGYREKASLEESIRRTVEWEASQIASGSFERPIDYAAEDALLNS